MNALDVFVWWLVLGWFPTSAGAALAIAAFGPGPYGYRARHGRRRGGLTLAVVPEVCTSAEDVWAARARIDARAVLAELMRPALLIEETTVAIEPDEIVEAMAWFESLQPPKDLHPELHRYEQAAGSSAYVSAPRAPAERFAPLDSRERDERITTREMVLRFGEQLAPVLAPAAALDEWLDPEPVGAQ